MSLFFWLNLPVAAVGIAGLAFGIRAEVREYRRARANAGPVSLSVDPTYSHTASEFGGGSR